MTGRPLDPGKRIVCNTASHRGRKIAVSPQNSLLSHLCYGRIIFDGKVSRVAFDNGNQETALICTRREGHGT
ncbi:MAG: hypothetical protein JXP73_03075 [Deltaproteobacteria bacterium]|jgi:5-deoxy-glucuronate isomerase|nr:hypothetical protein [Deltaproteobacteria bacterium]